MKDDSDNLSALKATIYRIHRSLRQHLKHRPALAPRLVVAKARWLDDRTSPVFLMIDDLTNAWFDRNGNGRMDPGEDWGAGLDGAGSVMQFLRRNLFDRHPRLKAVFLTTAGAFQSFSAEVPFTLAAPMNHDGPAKRFFRDLHFDVRFELGYHGLHHGVLESAEARWIQEWDTFESREAAVEQIERGKAVFKDAVGVVPRGGKYCGYRYNRFSDQSIADAGFCWWARDWLPVDPCAHTAEAFYDMGFFGPDGTVVSVPSNIHGGRWTWPELNWLLARRLPVGVQEHIASFKTNGRVQTPNVIDDIRSLRALFSYLDKRRVWYATCAEAAEYFMARERTTIYDVSSDGFALRYDGRTGNPWLTLLIDAGCLCSQRKPYIEVKLPDSSLLAGQQITALGRFRFRVHLPVQSGRYHLSAVAQAQPRLTAALSGGRIHYSSKGRTGCVRLFLPSDGEHRFFVVGSDGQRRMARQNDRNEAVFRVVDSRDGDRLEPV